MELKIAFMKIPLDFR